MANVRNRTSGKGSNGGDDPTADEGVRAEAARGVRSFVGYPSGLAALDDRKDNDGVLLVNLALNRHHLHLPHAFKRTNDKPMMKRAMVLPFGTTNVEWARDQQVQPITVRDARPILETQEGKWIRHPHDHFLRPPKLVVAPPRGDCGGSMTFEAFGRTWETCPFANCPHHGGTTYAWSVTQVQHLIGSLETEGAMRLLIEGNGRDIPAIDPRAPVAMWAQSMITRRRDARRERMGIGADAARSAVY